MGVIVTFSSGGREGGGREQRTEMSQKPEVDTGARVSIYCHLPPPTTNDTTHNKQTTQHPANSSETPSNIYNKSTTMTKLNHKDNHEHEGGDEDLEIIEPDQ